jgi:hypothetical protein
MKLLAALSLFLLAAPAPEMRYFHFTRPIVVPAQASGQTCVLLNADVFAHASSQLADLRLYQGTTETPYVVHSDVPLMVANENATLVNLGKSAGETTFDAEMTDGSYSDLQLDVDGHDFLATVTVLGSQLKATASRTTLGSFTIFDFTRQGLGRSTVLHLTPSNFRFLHFAIAGPIEPRSIKGLSITRPPVSQPRYVTVAETANAAVKGRDQVFEFTVPAHAPVDRIDFVPRDSASSFSRDVEIGILPAARARADDSTEPPQPVVGSGSILRVRTQQGGHKIDEEHLIVSPPRASFDGATKWAVTIKNRDDAPVPMASVRLQMLERNLCFDAVAGSAFTLYYGDAALAAPVYDYSALFVLQKNPIVAQLGPQAVNVLYQPRPDERPFTEKHPALLWTALILVIALLGFVAMRSFHATQAHPPSKPE